MQDDPFMSASKYHYTNTKRSHNNLSCRFCEDNVEESQEHLEVCRGGDFERRKLRMSNWKGKVTFWRRMTKKMDDRGRVGCPEKIKV